MTKINSFLFFFTLALVFQMQAQAQSSSVASMEDERPPGKPTLGHILIHTSNMEEALSFYQETLDMRINEKAQAEGEVRYFLTNNESHHQLVLKKESRLAGNEDRVIQQIAFKVPDHDSLLRYYNRLKDQNELELKNNQISWSIYLHDPDGNQIEIYWDIRDLPFGSSKWKGQSEDLTEDMLLRGRP